MLKQLIFYGISGKILSLLTDLCQRTVKHVKISNLLSDFFFFSIDNKKSIQGLILHKIGMIAVNMRYITAIDP